MQFEKKWIMVNGHRQRAWIYRQKSTVKPPIVCMHEGLGCLELWRDFPERLAKMTERDVYLFERFGHGQSGVLPGDPDGTYQMCEARNALPEMMDQMNIETASFVGHSDGGTIALLFAGLFPDRVLDIVTMAAHVYGDPVGEKGLKQAIYAYENMGLREKMLPYHGEGTDGMFWRWARTWTNPEFRDWTIHEELKSIRCPVLAIQGELDEYGANHQITSIQKGVNGPAESWLIPDTGHNPHLERPQIILERIKAFLETGVQS